MEKLFQDLTLDAPHPGYRLCQLTVLNWGTFNQKAWRITPGGYTSLLTGANGSGKSTLVDALLTLLVPNQKRNYNKASGPGRRSERDERTYVLGAYSKLRGEDGYAAKTQYLRTKDDYAVLLAQFCHQQAQETVTLAQMFWLQDGAVRKFFVVATKLLTLEDDFGSFDGNIAAFKKRLRANKGVEVFDQFNQYNRRFRKHVGLESEKALELFNQTVMIKEVGNLNAFVRTHMLERTNARDNIDQLRHNFHDLTRAYEAIARAKKQLDLLQPMMRRAARYKKLQQEIVTLAGCTEAIPAYFGRQKLQLLEAAIAEVTEQRQQADHRLRDIDRQLDALRQQARDLDIAISNDQVGQELQNLERRIKEIDGRLTDKQAQARRYNQLAQGLNLPVYDVESVFYASRQKSQTYLQGIEVEQSKVLEQQIQVGYRLQGLTDEVAQLETELSSLRQRKSQIPAQQLEVRRRMLDVLKIPESDVPFIGELLKVQEGEGDWEGAIERLLHNFGLRLLVPETHYSKVSRYVDQTNLRGRLVFHRVGDVVSTPRLDRLTKRSLYYKLEIKPNTSFYDWISQALIAQFNYTCCDDLTQFRRAQRAITTNGLIKRGGDYHEKDDRRDLKDRKFYILGWNNQDKIVAIEAELAQQRHQLEQVQAKQKQAREAYQQFEKLRNQLTDFLRFDNFVLIDWRPEAEALERLRIHQQQLQQSSNRLRELQTQYTQMQQAIRQTEQQRQAVHREVNRYEMQIETYQQQQSTCEQRLSLIPLAEAEAYFAQIEIGLPAQVLQLETIDTLEREQHEHYLKHVSDERLRLSRWEKTIEKDLQQYKIDYPAETTEVDASIEALTDYERMFETIQQEDLPRHEKRFKELLDEKVIANVVLFKSALERQEEEIRENVTRLNIALARIDYTDSTFIQLAAETNRDAEIREFRQALVACLPDVGQPKTAAANEASFQRIKALIERFEIEDRWTLKVTDVRNWLNFSASERYKEDGAERHYYSDSSGKSGGQKAKLAYTILASAIAYQYGFSQDERRTKSFRFVVVDEAFSKSDEANARYAMELFEKLGLQLLVVTPLDKIHIVESYISACHFVSNNEEENDSRVIDMTIAEYMGERERFLAAEQGR